jgi:hypothetical protein
MRSCGGIVIDTIELQLTNKQASLLVNTYQSNQTHLSGIRLHIGLFRANLANAHTVSVLAPTVVGSKQQRRIVVVELNTSLGIDLYSPTDSLD